jgi:hypothetical protein
LRKRRPVAPGPSASGFHLEGTNRAFPSAHPEVLPDPSQLYTYIGATGGNAGGGVNSSIALVTSLGSCIDGQSEVVEINEVTTAVFAAAIEGLELRGYDPSDPLTENALENALTGTFQTIIDLPTGTVKPNTVSTTGGTSITIDAAKIYSLANTIASCVNSSDGLSGTTPIPSSACQTLFADSTITIAGSPNPPLNTLQAAAYIEYQPYVAVKALYNLAGAEAPFTGLSVAPNDWTIGISYSTPTMGLGIFPNASGQPTSSNIDIDRFGRVWFPSNKSGASGIGYFDPTEAAFNGPFGNADLIDPQYIALDGVNQVVWATDSSNAAVVELSTAVGSEGALQFEGTYLDALNGGVPHSTGPIAINYDQSLVLNYDATDGSINQVAFGGDGTPHVTVSSSPFFRQPTGLALNVAGAVDPTNLTAPVGVSASSDGTACDLEETGTIFGDFAFVTKSVPCTSGGAATGLILPIGQQDTVGMFTTLNSFCSALLQACSTLSLLNAPQGVAFDGNNQVWFANSANGSIFTLAGSTTTASYSFTSNVDYLHGGTGGTMIKPVGLAIDRTGNVWTSNATCTSTTDTTCVYTLSELLGNAAATITPLSDQAMGMQGSTPAITHAPHNLIKGMLTPLPRNAAPTGPSVFNR